MAFDRKVFSDIEDNIRSLDIDEIKKRLQPLMAGYGIRTPVLDPGMFVYRARRLGTALKKDKLSLQHLIYPPASLATLGRINRAGQSMFYSSVSKEAIFFELAELKEGDEIIVTFWKTTQRALVNNIGYTEYAFKQLSATRTLPQWGPSPSPGSTEETITLPAIPKEIVEIALSHDENRALNEILSDYFMRKVTLDLSSLYKLTTAIGEIHLGSIGNNAMQFAGLLYPSVRMWGNGDNLALLPWFVDNHLEFRKAVHVRIKGRADPQMQIEYLDAAHKIDVSDHLSWLGRIKKWALQPQQTGNFRCMPGRDEDGDYTIGADGVPCHWTGEDAHTGMPIEMD
jgi:hypothetical protein